MLSWVLFLDVYEGVYKKKKKKTYSVQETFLCITFDTLPYHVVFQLPLFYCLRLRVYTA